ncbi:MAG: class I tRNA ligase family protein, partial [Acidimicrobiales bacterium]
VRHWMHQEMVRMDGEKMSKSLGNLVFVSDLLAEYDPRAVRLLLLAHHYRDSWEWDPKQVDEADERLRRWVQAADRDADAALEQVRTALDDDLDTAAAVRAVDEGAVAGEGVSAAAALLGVDLRAHVG